MVADTEIKKFMCTRPLHFFRSDIPDEEGKYPGFITGYNMEIATYDDFHKRGIECTLGRRVKAIEVPCGKCPECKRAIKFNWVGRCVAEMETSKYSYFLTLTYNDECLRDCTKREIQLFIKRLRKFISFRYLAVAELGSLSNRPHYHLIIYCDEELKDLHHFKRGLTPLYTSDIVEQCWPFGYSTVGKGEACSIAYTLGYLLTKEKKTAFKLQSQGLGAKYFEKLKERYILSNGRGQELYVGLPRYLKRKYNLDFYYNPAIGELMWRNELFNAGMPDYKYRDHKEYLEKAKFNA